MKRITVDVVIPAYKPDDTFRDLIGMLLRQTYPAGQPYPDHQYGRALLE